MAPPPLSESSTEKASAGDDDGQSKNEKQATTPSRENFLRRLEQQQQLKSPPEENASNHDGTDPEKKSASSEVVTTKQAGGDNISTTPAVKSNVGTKPITQPEKGTTHDKPAPVGRPPSNSQQKFPVGEELLLNYLSNYCELPRNRGTDSPADWIQDIDPSSLDFLKGLANNNGNSGSKQGIPRHDVVGSDSGGIRESKNENDPAIETGRRKSNGSSNHTQPSRTNSENPPSRPNSNPPSRSSSSTNIMNKNTTTTTKNAKRDPREEQGNIYEIVVPPHVSPGQPFPLLAGGVKVMVTCPKNANPGQKIRFHLPVDVVPPPGEKKKKVVPPTPPPVENNWSNEKQAGEVSKQEMTRMALEESMVALGKQTNDRGLGDWPVSNPSPPTKPSTSGNNDDDIQHRMLSIIESQQLQMYEMQARLDALGTVMLAMEKDVKYLRCRDEGKNDNAQQDRRLLGGLFGGAGTAAGGGRAGAAPAAGGQPGFGGGGPGQQGTDPAASARKYLQQQQGQQGMDPGAPAPQYLQQQQKVPGQQRPRETVPKEEEDLPEAEQKNNENLPEASYVVPRPQNQQTGRQRRPQNQRAPVPNPGAPRHEQVLLLPQNQGIFFPLFLMLFRFLISLPGRLRTVLLTTGVGRIYVHLRERAIERRAFAHVDLASIVKLLVMLIIFSGRVGDNGGNGGAARNNRRRNGEEEEFGIMAHAYSLLQSVIDYWNGHRVHTLVLASFIGFLIQVGLLKFLYNVIWVERGELLQAWLGHNTEEDDDLAGEDGHEANHGGDALRRGVDANDAPPGQVGRDQNPDDAAHPAAAPAAPMGGIIRRGPNNGGFLHDIQCLILSFLLSLIPAWRPEEAAEEVEEADQGEPDLGEQPAAVPVQDGGDDGDADDGNDAAE